jgi:hypothetical protein
MRSPSVLAFRPRRVLALAGLVSLIGGLLMLPGLAHPGRAAAAAGTPAASAAGAAGCTGKGTTVTGQKLWDGTSAPLPDASCVTMGQTSNLVNQMVHVTWANFTPSQNPPYSNQGTTYPVMIAECKGTNPASAADCYGATNGGVAGQSGPSGPMNSVYAMTAPDGTGQADILINTKTENQFLGCDQNHACSVVVVPAQGGNPLASPPVCTDHSQDRFFAVGLYAFSLDHGACSWADRMVIPLAFAPTPAACGFKNAAFGAGGSPMLARAMSSWVARLCLGRRGLTIEYNSNVAEPQAVQETAQGLFDVALTTRPASAQGITTQRHYLYAPVAVSAVSVAYWIDDPASGLPVTGIKLDQRLLLKLLTQSYNFQNEGIPCSFPQPPAGPGCDTAVAHANPLTLFADPEFQGLNPGVQPVTGIGAPFQVPTVQSGHSDMTWFVTRWIAANKGARQFHSGRYDPWGMHVNLEYEGDKVTYPTDTFTAQDSYPVIAHRYSPLFPPWLVATYQAQNWEPGTAYFKDQFGNFPKDPIQPPGQRALFAVLDQGDAAAFRFPVAAIPNGAGNYVRPSNSAMAAALHGMQSGGSGTQQVNLASKNKAAYPLTMVIYAMVPTSGTPHAKAAAIARFLNYAAGAGQKEGLRPGQLPPGYLPLPAGLAAKTRKAAIAVLNQTGATTTPNKPPHNNPGGGGGPGGGSGTSSGSSSNNGAGGSGSQSGSSPANAGPPISFVPVNASPAGLSRYVLPALLILGGLAALAGSSSLVGSDPAEAMARLRSMGRSSLAWTRNAGRFAGLRRKG